MYLKFGLLPKTCVLLSQVIIFNINTCPVILKTNPTFPLSYYTSFYKPVILLSKIDIIILNTCTCNSTALTVLVY